MKNRILTILLSMAAILPMTTMAQSAMQIMDKTAAKLKSSGGIQASFTATQFKKTTEGQSVNGKIDISDKCFYMNSQQMSSWFDGKTQWTMIAGSGEVNVSTPTAQELQQMNPYQFVDLYKSGYSASVTNYQYEGKSCHNVRLVAKKKGKEIQEMRIVIDKNTYLPYSIRILQKNGDWFRLRVTGIKTGQKWNQSHFQFSPKDHPNIEVIDLR